MLIAILVGLSACASAPRIPSSSQIVINVAGEMPCFEDDRDKSDTSERTWRTRTEAAHWLADNAFDPPLPRAINGLFAQQLATTKKPCLTLLELRVGVFKNNARASADITRAPPRMVAEAYGAALRATVSDVRSLADGDAEQWTVEIVVKLDGRRYVSYKRKARFDGVAQDVALRELLDESVAEVLSEHSRSSQ